MLYNGIVIHFLSYYEDAEHSFCFYSLKSTAITFFDFNFIPNICILDKEGFSTFSSKESLDIIYKRIG